MGVLGISGNEQTKNPNRQDLNGNTRLGWNYEAIEKFLSWSTGEGEVVEVA